MRNILAASAIWARPNWAVDNAVASDSGSIGNRFYSPFLNER
jgi:hypothetical protein